MNKFMIAAAVAVLVPGTALASPYYASIGSPNSLQHTAVTTALNLNDLDYDENLDTPGFDMEGDADTIGGAFTYWGGAGAEGQRYELRYQKAFRPFEGSRARVLVDPILNVLHVNKGDTAVLGTLSAGVELPVQPNWLITPRVAFGASNNDGYFGASSEVLTLSATSRYKIAQLGRGDLTIGNMVGWSTTTDTGIGKKPFFYFKEDVWSFRNGIAYQLPFKGRMFGGRQGSLRASYTWTKLAGDPQAYENVHEAALSVGIRTREAEQKSRAEQLRIGLIYTRGVSSVAHDFDFDAVTLTIGYRF